MKVSVESQLISREKLESVKPYENKK
jgi:hypothetical protein